MPLDYLVVGHVTRDIKGSSFVLGGTAAYAARTAQALGCRVGVVTSAGDDLDLRRPLSDIAIARLRARTSTTFENVYAEAARRQVVLGVAAPLGPGVVPDDWEAQLVHIGPVARECDPALVRHFGGAFIGVTPQGWMRQWDDAGNITQRRWEEMAQVLPYADAVVLSEADIGGDTSVVTDLAGQTRYLAVTQGAAGCTVYTGGDVRDFPAPNVEELDPTGAGDIFAACFFYALHQAFDAWTAARFANCIAARSVTRSGLRGTPLEEDVAYCRRTALTG